MPKSSTIHHPIPVVLAFLLDGMNNPLWRPGVGDIQRMPGALHRTTNGAERALVVRRLDGTEAIGYIDEALSSSI